MNFSLIWLGLFSALTSAMFVTQTGRNYPRFLVRQNRKSYNLRQDNDCYCFKKQPSHKYVHQQLMKDGHGLDRLIVYFYKDTVTQEIVMYTPNAARQFLIPDLAFEENDDLSVATDRRVSNIFNNNPNVIQIMKERKKVHENRHILPVPHDQSDVIPPVIPVHDYGNDNGNILPQPDGQSDEIEPVIPVPDDGDDNENILPEPDNQSDEIELVIPVPDDGNDSENILPEPDDQSDEIEPVIPLPDDGNDNENILPEPDDQSDEIEPIIPVPDDGNDQPLPDDDQSDDDDLIPIVVPDSDKEESNENYVPDNEAYITFAKWVSQQMHRVKHGLIQSDSISVLKIQLEKILRDNGMYVSKDGLLRDENGFITNLTNLQLTPILIGSSVRYDKLLSLDNPASLTEEVSYLEAVLISLINPPKILGIAPLKKVRLPRGPNWSSQSIVDYVSKDQGKPCNKPNCYGPFLGSSAVSDQVKIQKKVIYSNGNRREDSSHRENFTNGVSKETMKFIQKTKEKLFKDELLEQSGKISSLEQSSVKKEDVNEKPTGDKSQESDKEEVTTFRPITGIDITKKKDEIDALAGVPIHKESYISQYSENSGGLVLSPVKTVQGKYAGQEFNKNKGIGIAVSPGRSIDKQSAKKSSPRQSKLGYRVRDLINELSTVVLKDGDSEEESVEEETPGFRIIGGSAATGSGLPLSNKGRRSGWVN